MLSHHGRRARERAATRRTPAVVVPVLVQNLSGTAKKLLDLDVQAWALHRLGHRRSLRCRGEEGQQPVPNRGRRLLRGTLVHVDPQDIESGLDQPLGSLPVEVHLGV